MLFKNIYISGTGKGAFYHYYHSPHCILPNKVNRKVDEKVQRMKRDKTQNFHRWYDYQHNTQNNSQNENNSEGPKENFTNFLDAKSR